MDFNFAKLIITVALKTDVPDPCVLFGTRREFAAAFRQVVGCRCTCCDGCQRAALCPYHKTLGQEVSSEPAAVKRYQKPPLPFVFSFPVIPPLRNRGTELEIGLVLVGNAIDHLDFYMAAFGHMLLQVGQGKGGGASIRRLESVDYAGNRHLVEERGGHWAPGGLALLSVRGLCKSELLPMDSITINLETPLRIMHEAKPLREISFSAIVRSLMRRISAMAYYYAGSETDVDFKWLAMRSKSVKSVHVDFHWVEWGKGVSGVIGTGTFIGELTEFHPFLLAGEQVHAGKGAAFGLGRFHLDRAQ